MKDRRNDVIFRCRHHAIFDVASISRHVIFWAPHNTPPLLATFWIRFLRRVSDFQRLSASPSLSLSLSNFQRTSHHLLCCLPSLSLISFFIFQYANSSLFSCDCYVYEINSFMEINSCIAPRCSLIRVFFLFIPSRRPSR